MNYKTILPKQFNRPVDNSKSDYNIAALKSLEENKKDLLPLAKKTSKMSIIYTDLVKNCDVVVVDNSIGEVVLLFLNNGKILECTK